MAEGSGERQIPGKLWELCASQPDHDIAHGKRCVRCYLETDRRHNLRIVVYRSGLGVYCDKSFCFCGSGSRGIQILCRKQRLPGKSVQDSFRLSMRPLWKCSSCYVPEGSVPVIMDFAPYRSRDCKEL